MNSRARQQSYQRESVLLQKMQGITHVFFDVDGTLLDDDASLGSVWARIHALAGVTQATRDQRLARHQCGELAYNDWMSLDIGDWQRAGICESDILRLCSSMRLSEGARETVEELHARGYILGIISSSIDLGIFAHLKPELFRECSINRLNFGSDGRITGWDTSACKLAEKGARLKEWSKSNHVAREQIAFIGNDFNDIGAAEFAGVSFAFNCRDAGLRDVSTWIEESGDMTSLLKYFNRK